LEKGKKEHKERLKYARKHWAAFIVFKLQVINWVRCEAIRNVTVANYNDRVPDPEDPSVKVVTITETHKTAISHGPATFMVTEIIECLIDTYLQEVRPHLETDNSMDYLFLNSTNGMRLQESNTSANFKKYWQKCGGKGNVTPHFLRHSAATIAREICPER